MAERATGKAKRASQRVAPEPSRAGGAAAPITRSPMPSGGVPVPGGDASSDLERERDTLKAELEAARAEIATLQQQRDQIVNRIDWIIDSLHTLLEDERG